MAPETLRALMARFKAARSQTDALFRLIVPDALYDRPIPERHRLIFYLGHLEAFDWNLLGRWRSICQRRTPNSTNCSPSALIPRMVSSRRMRQLTGRALRKFMTTTGAFVSGSTSASATRQLSRPRRRSLPMERSSMWPSSTA